MAIIQNKRNAVVQNNRVNNKNLSEENLLYDISGPIE